MKLLSVLLATGIAASAVIEPPLVPHDNKVNLFEHNTADAHGHKQAQSPSPSPFRIPTSAESAVLGRRILALTPFGTISTVFPHDGASAANPGTAETRPLGLGGVPVGLPEYLADCEGDSGNPTLLAISIATTFRNAAAGSNVSLTLQWEPPYAPAERVSLLDGMQRALGRHEKAGPAAAASAPSVASLPRFSLLGYLEPITEQSLPISNVATCFVKAHPDARWWLPGNPIHRSEWFRLVVTNVYWIGGFGDRNYIGWIPVEEWQNVTRSEWEQVRLPGEQSGWKESEIGHRL